MRATGTGLALGGHGAGASRWAGLARRALDEVGASADDALVIATCNGGAEAIDETSWRDAFDARALLAGTRWASSRPVVSASCASGMQGLWWARALLDAGAPSVVVLAADAISPVSLANFEVLRVLAPSPQPPWRGDSAGFIHGEAAAAIRLVRSPDTRAGSDTARIHGPVLGVELGLGADLTMSDGGLGPLVGGIGAPELVIGQGTGPALVDDLELAAIAGFAGDAPLATAGFVHGHTLGASSLLGLVLAIRGGATGLDGNARDGRRLAPAIAAGARAVIVCRALGGACGVISTDAPLPASAPRLVTPRRAAPCMTPALAAILDAAARERPPAPPAALIAVLEHPLQPPERARRGDRLLPSAVLEITPGAVAVAVARAWGYSGPALALVATPDDARPWIDATPGACVLYVRGDGDERHLAWQHLAR